MESGVERGMETEVESGVWSLVEWRAASWSREEGKAEWSVAIGECRE